MITRRRSRRRGTTGARIAAWSGAAALMAAIGAAARMRRAHAGAGTSAPTRSPGRSGLARLRGRGGPPGAAEQSWECACGQRFRVAGVERHRVYWVAGAPESDPVMSDLCPSCERPLPTAPAATVG
jgi:hypothetical protein